MVVGGLSLEELKSAFGEYQRMKDRCSESGDWQEYANSFGGPDCFIDHHGMGRFDGPEGVQKYIVSAMKPYPKMTFPIDWVAYDIANCAVVFQVQNAFPTPPFRPDGKTPFQFPNWTRVTYDPRLRKWTSEETVYNPLRDAQRTVKEWRKAGGVFAAPEALKYVYSKYPQKDSKL